MRSSNPAKTNVIWHRRIGLSVFVLLMFLAISGIALNHSPALKLNKISLSSNWLLSWYGLEKSPINAFKLNEKWLFENGNNLLYVDGQSVAPCSAPLLSVANSSNILFALCADTLHLLTDNGQLLESYSQMDGLPASTGSIVAAGNTLYLLTDSAVFEFNPHSLDLKPSPEVDRASLNPITDPQTLPELLEQQLKNSGPSISLETVILDLHSGRFFGQFGVLVMDIVGLLVCILSITGLLAWISRLRQIKQ
jgi:hypothetical protein